MENLNQQTNQQYKTIKKDNHSILGPIQHIQIDQKRYTVKVKTYTNNHQLENAFKKIESRNGICRNNEEKHILQIHHTIRRQAKGYCSNLRQLQIVYQEIQQDLHQQFLFRKCNRQAYSEQQILSVIGQLLQALKFLQERQFRAYHISSKSIFKRKQNNYCLILHEDAECLHPIDEYTHNFNGELFNLNYYLSPKQLININKSYIPSQYSIKDHIFTLGIISLNLCLMKELAFQSDIISVRIHDKEKYFVFDENLVKKQVIKFKKIVNQINYSNKVKQILYKMIQFQQNNRLQYQDFFKITQSTSNQSITQELPLKKTLKILQSRPHSKQNINVIAPSFYHIQPQQPNQNINNVFIDAKHLFQQNNTSIATQAKHYKRAKLSSIKLDNKNIQNQVSYAITQELNSPSIITPIKKLNDHLILEDELNILKGIKYGQAQSIYGISNSTIKNSLASKTSFAINMKS